MDADQIDAKYGPRIRCQYCGVEEGVVHKDYCPRTILTSRGPEPAKETGAYPDDNPKTVLGVSKPSLSVVPPIAMYHMGQAMRDGKEKYGLMNWREHRVSSSVYYDAALRHLMAWWDGENRASDSGIHHLGHAMACMAIILDAESIGQLNDDRPVLGGNLPAFLAANTKANT